MALNETMRSCGAALRCRSHRASLTEKQLKTHLHCVWPLWSNLLCIPLCPLVTWIQTPQLEAWVSKWKSPVTSSKKKKTSLERPWTLPPQPLEHLRAHKPGGLRFVAVHPWMDWQPSRGSTCGCLDNTKSCHQWACRRLLCFSRWGEAGFLLWSTGVGLVALKPFSVFDWS